MNFLVKEKVFFYKANMVIDATFDNCMSVLLKDSGRKLRPFKQITDNN